MVTTAFGKAEIAEQVALRQRVNGKQFSTLVQLLEDERGEWLIRFAYATDGVARRGPVTLRGSDVERLRVALRKTPAVAGAAGHGGVSEPEPDIDVPYELRGGVWADDVDVFGDKMKAHKLTPEEEAVLARRRQEIWARARARLRERDGR